MELKQFITTAIKAIGKGIEEGKEGNIVPGFPIGSSTVPGVEFDLLVVTDKEGKIHIKDYPNQNVNLASRIKFVIPIIHKDETPKKFKEIFEDSQAGSRK